MDNRSYPSNVGKPMPDSFFPVAQRSARVYRSRTHRGVSIALMRSVCLHPSGSSTPSATTAPIQSTGQGSCAQQAPPDAKPRSPRVANSFRHCDVNWLSKCLRHNHFAMRLSGRVEQFSRRSASADTTRASNQRRCGDRHSTSHQRRLARRPRGMRCRCRPGQRCRCPLR